MSAKCAGGLVEFRILGPVEVRIAGQNLSVGHARQRSVLAVLILDLCRAVSAELLIDRVWGEDPPASVRNVLYGYVARLRALIADAGDPGISLTRQQSGYLLQAEPGHVDICRFRRLVTEASAAGENDQRAARLLDDALKLWHGPALAGLNSPWLTGMRHRLEMDRTAAVLDLNDIRLRQGQHRALASELTEQVAASPADERLTGQLMLALYRSGRQAEALRCFERTRLHLADELGADPGPQLQQLHQQILIADPALEPGNPLRLTVGGAVRVAPRQLPAAVAHFAGRANELAELTGLLDRPDEPVPGAIPVFAIGGTAGVGKTALAVRWAHQVSARFPDGQLYVNLRGYDPARPVAATDALAGFLGALGVGGQDIPAGQDERAALYRSILAGMRILVILDNAASEQHVRPLLPGTPACAVVVTSRDSLAGLVARDGAHRLDLDLLPLDDAVELLRELVGERADADPHAVTALAVQCCRLPLALRVAAELAAARRAAPLTALVDELADQQQRLDLLDAGGDPHTALRTVLSWSYRHLDGRTARAYWQAALHPGSDLDPYAVAALTDVSLEQGRSFVEVLVRAHLIHRTTAGRYGMHDLLRAYACELATAHEDAGQQHAALTRLFDHYLYTAAAAMNTLHPAGRDSRPRIPPPATPVPPVTDPAAALAWLDAERDTLVAISAHTAGHGWPSHATRLSATLFRYLDAGSHYPEAITIHTHARDTARRTGDRAAEATALNHLAGPHRRQGRYQLAIMHYRHALALFQQSGDCTGQAHALGNLGNAYADQGRYPAAISLHEQALDLYRQLGDAAGEARTLGNLGYIEERQGRYQHAARHQQQSLAIARENGHGTTECVALINLGTIELRQDRCQSAAGYLYRALTLCRDTGYRFFEADALTKISGMCLRQGRPQDATSHLQAALALYQETGNRSGEADALNILGEILLATGQPGHARTQHSTALSLANQIGDKYQQAHAHHGLGHAYRATENPTRAHSHWQAALDLYTELDVPEADQVRAQFAAIDRTSSGSRRHLNPVADARSDVMELQSHEID
jgi:DNA-binding SARP family transcriptional activator